MGDSSTSMSDAAARQSLKADLDRICCRVHQPDDPKLFTREPESPMVPVHWRWRDLEPMLQRIGESITIGSGGQRRTLRLANPGLPYGTTTSFWASIQVILPGEVAEAHRHSASAFRFIMHGTGASTTVDGQAYPMNEGDLVLTPPWTWHDHTHRGAEPMIWLDVLDISLMRSMHAAFFQPHPDGLQRIDDVPDQSWRAYGSGLMRPPRTGPAPAAVNPLLVYPAQRTTEALESASGLPSDPHEDVVLEYQNPIDGGPAMTVLAMKRFKLRPGFQGRARRRTGSTLLYVMEGTGRTVVAGNTFDWGPGDFIAVPPWAWLEHHNSGDRDANLFEVNDTPVLRALGYYREESA